MKKFYLLQVLCHKWFVLLAGFKVGDFPLWRLIIHDWSKFLPCEYVVYKRRFTGKSYTEEDWKRAWLHHIHFNPHHYEYWILNGEPILIPDIFIKEMVIDWMGAGKGYQGSWDIQPWINTNHKKILLHRDTMRKLEIILKAQGFSWPKS